MHQILAWSDAFFKRRRRWPIVKDGLIRETLDDTWLAIDKALRYGRRGLEGGSSLARLLSEHRGVRNRKALTPYSIKAILAWADAYRSRTGHWPNADSGPIGEAPGETWYAIESALRTGIRGLQGGSSLARLLAAHRGARNQAARPRLTVREILRWADAWHRRTGRWPKNQDGAIPESPGDGWHGINACLRQGNRGLPGGQTLAHLLSKHRGARHHLALPRLTQRKILTWADAHFKRTGAWPKAYSGEISEAPDETWRAVDVALLQGGRGLPGGSSLALLLHRRRNARHGKLLPAFSEPKIAAWAQAYRRRVGKFPTGSSGSVAESPGDTWLAVDMALRKGRRGLPGGSSLARLLKSRQETGRGKRRARTQ
ncbi:MAG TPA: hypothetical protein VG826_11735 [Pirellulales bacterium]|nr:hypothetical protein [Pirellulales bacterium]